MEEITQAEMHEWTNDNHPRLDEEKEIFRTLCLHTQRPNCAPDMHASHGVQQARERAQEQGMER